MTITADILAFASGRPLWEQDLLRRIFTQADLTSEDLEEALGLIKKAAGIEGFADAAVAVPLSAGHILHQPEGSLPVVLASIGDAEHAMRLAGGQSIPFAVDGITIVYGENGSGKSGYCKLLKQICRARRERAEDIVLQNVYAEAQQPPATVCVRFRVGTEEVTTLPWVAGNPGPNELSRISVFDSRLAPLYADKEDKIEFLPAGLDVLPRLVRACEDLAQRINTEVQPLKHALTLPLPAMIEGTQQAAAVALLIEKTPPAKLPSVETLQTLGTWSEVDATELQRIEADLSSDPVIRAQAARQAADAIRHYLDNLTSLQAKLSDEAIAVLAAQIAAYHSARLAAQTAAAEQFKADPLGRVVGGDPWRQMFVYAAQVYHAAFPDHEFPSQGKARLCPLCEQHLDDPAFDRIRRFQAFIGNAAQKDADAKGRQLANRAAEYDHLEVPNPNSARAALTPYAVADSPEAHIINDLVTWLGAAASRKLIAAAAARSASPSAPTPALPAQTIALIAAWHDRLEVTIREAEVAAGDPHRIDGLQKAAIVLRARRTLRENLAAILLRREQLVQLKKLLGCIPARYTQPISGKNTELCQKYLTDDFAKKLRTEMQGLGIDYLPVVVRGRTDKGANYVGPDLTKSVAARTSNILSEGEFRALSLACFFAEIDIIDGHNGIILDDPVSSLDHHHVRQVAARLIKEAKTRQVIVFTHELSFYYELWHQAIDENIRTSRHWVKKTEEFGFGTVEKNAAPWQAKSTKDRLGVLDSKLAAIKARNDGHTEVYERAIVDFYSSLRETWERLVEEKLLGEVVGRFQPGVHTQMLSKVEVTDTDYRTVYLGMKRASEFSGHDWAKGRLSNVPKISVMEKSIEDIRTYVHFLNKRGTDIASGRKKAVESPPVAETV